MAESLTLLAEKKPYYPGFRDLNLLYVALALMGFLYLILVTNVAYRVISTGKKIEELDGLLKAVTPEDPRWAKLATERDNLAAELVKLTATAPGSWFSKRHKRP